MSIVSETTEKPNVDMLSISGDHPHIDAKKMQHCASYIWYVQK